ncbi:hypothetical protein TorRG33x02_152130 [Trema orientale]|uniref:Retrovirus-related Pol polyprotein from transposon TNT 1-94-like beta-barrel domain-containing protein n=1 Tax=Trema orientale TaxID=63057 RepID=A0A2P5ETX6_TREOI|nr:hypothetical protein TorRG33x02_152130 [Trema orientale]
MVDMDDGWWLDSSAICHVTPHRSVFISYKEMKDKINAYMRNSAPIAVAGIRSVNLLLSSRKTLTLKNVYHVLGLKKSLVSIYLLGIHGFCVMFESDKVVLTKKGSFIGKGYAKDKIYLLSLVNNNIASSSYFSGVEIISHFDVYNI